MSDTNQVHKLTDDEILKMEAAVIRLSEVTKNAQAITLAHNLRLSGGVEEKRKWIVLFYVSCFQLLSFLNMGRDNEQSLEIFKKNLQTQIIQDYSKSTPNGKQ